LTGTDREALIGALSAEEIAAIEREAAHLPRADSAAIEALRIVQGARGWVSDESVRAIAELLGMSPAQVDSVATFYNLIFRRPVGRHVIMVCDSVSCFVMGCDRVRERLEDTLGIRPGETTEDGRFTLLPIVCLGACDRAPVMMVGETIEGPVDPEQLPALLERYP
jgi:NADH-quinone oxidoreductase subunit E